MKTSILLSAAFVLSGVAGFYPAQAQDLRLTGSGASFPFPLYSSWFKDFSRQTQGVTVDYQAKGSGAGIQDFTNNTVDFAASDAAMSDEEIAKIKQGVVLLPMTAGEIVLSYNLDGVRELKLPRDVYPDIFAGKIAKWNDPKIAAANPGVKLPDQNITVVARSDSSGTTYVFTGHLSEINPAFKSSVGHGTTVQWPTAFVKAPKNDGVTATIKQTPGAIGYIEYTYAIATKQPMAVLQNKAGHYIAPSDESGKAALASAAFPDKALPGSDAPDLRVWLFDPAGDNAYPIATFTWMLFYKDQDDAKAKVLRDLVEYGLTKGQAMAPKMGYIPLPDSVIAQVKKAAALIQ
ncbi:MAG TPA: phosphate ABC transporter substrate-binding protein PstS [Candidatus Competibacteraceae bacterium]|nr:phosphate ABC transporter substrate-binding protein PstS [Candidatus Competibacteraceae bacterium]